MPEHLIHRYWEGPPPPVDHRPALEALECGPVLDWGPDTLPDWIAQLIGSTVDLVAADRRAVHAANVARAGLLWQFGGWWADHDLEPLGTPWTLLPWPATAAHPNGTRCNCWLGFPRRHPAPAAVLVAISGCAEVGKFLPASNLAGCHRWRTSVGADVARVPVTGWARHHRWTSRR